MSTANNDSSKSSLSPDSPKSGDCGPDRCDSTIIPTENAVEKSDAGGERKSSSDDVITSLLLNNNQKKTFPGKLSLILNNPKHNDVICWTSNGNAWNILDAVKLEKEVGDQNLRYILAKSLYL